MKIGVLIYTYNRTDDAKINMEIIRHTWSQHASLKDVVIVHAYNGERDWYPEKYLEDDLVRIKNSWHFQGASDLLDAGMKRFKRHHRDIDYIIVLAADTWLVDPGYVESLIERMQREEKWLATCAWGLPERNEIRDVGMSVDLMIVDAKWAHHYKMFPINYAAFYKKYAELFLYQKVGNVMLEKLMLARYVQAASRCEGTSAMARKVAFEKLLIIGEREPVHSGIDEKGYWIRNMYWPNMGLLTHHDPEPKRAILSKRSLDGASIEKLVQSKDVSYFNQGITKMKGNCN